MQENNKENKKKPQSLRPKTRRQLYLENLAKGMTKYEAAIKAGYSKVTATIPYKIERTEAMQRELLSIMDTPEGKKLLADDNLLLEKILEILNQKREYSTKYKLTKDLLNQKGIKLDSETENTIQPQINIIVDKRNA